MGSRARRRQHEGTRTPAGSAVETIRSEWGALSRGELAFVALAAVAVVVLSVALPGGALGGIAAALGVGMAAGVAIGLNRRRRERGGTPREPSR